ncbi:ketosteroid isomerase-like protein [Saonia flava]|uniref:Ketosteroid isomerase-like protein n=1 Tax=Saonia flava TaxID=523696 RepID=A0A846R7E3_9FLAO|nr:nuclear transport factor 2 family protein [Saonia flava]NJB72689.1 ketosteroid isomerase-like protein [Saonia flava]
MRTLYSFLVSMLVYTGSSAQYNFEPSIEHPYGIPNPEAPQEVLDYTALIGECNCKSIARKADQTWAEPVDMIWRFKFIMNGMAVQDETLKADGKHSGSIRQFIPDSTKWYVHYYSSGAPTTILPVWEGNKNKDGEIVLYKEQKAPNGTDGFYRLTFSNISSEGYNWIGEWVSKDKSIIYPTWKINCLRTNKVSKSDEEKIMAKATTFSKAYINGDYETMTSIYTKDAKLFPNNTKIIEGHTDIKDRWILPEGVKILNHKTESNEINIIGNFAYDYGYYNGTTQRKDKSEVSWKGKYVIIWKKVNEEWKMYLDIWNSVVD